MSDDLSSVPECGDGHVFGSQGQEGAIVVEGKNDNALISLHSGHEVKAGSVCLCFSKKPESCDSKTRKVVVHLIFDSSVLPFCSN